MVSLEFIDPREIEKHQDIIDELKAFGIDHTTPELTSGWNYVLDHVWLALQIDKIVHKDAIVLDVGCGASPFHNFIETKYNINIIGIDRHSGYSQQPRHTNMDIESDFMDAKIKPHSVSLILWLSSLEHNELNTIKKLWKKSLSLLKPGGVILATIPIAKETAWFYLSEQTNLSVKDAVNIFKIDAIIDDYDTVHLGYESNVLHLRDKMIKRYQFDPKFVIAGLRSSYGSN